MTDLVFPRHKNRKSGKSVKIRSAVGKTKKHDRLADQHKTDLIIQDTVMRTPSFAGPISLTKSQPKAVI